MRADEQYYGDYLTLAAVALMRAAQDRGEHTAFAAGMYSLWKEVYEALPPDSQARMAAIVLDSYFSQAGDLGKALRQHEDKLAQTVGYERHWDAMTRQAQRILEAAQLLAVVKP